jgi:integrase/recombinase XerC
MRVTARREMQIVHVILNFATTKKAGRLIPYNPIAEDKLPAIDSEPITPPTHAQVLKSYKNACSYLKRAIMLSVNTGARVGASELLGIDWEDVDFDDEVITITSALKNREISYRQVAIIPEFRMMLERWRSEDAAARGIAIDDLSGPIIHYKGKQLKRLRMAWGRAFAKTDINRRIRPYDLRHFFATRLIERGADEEVTRVVMGHSDSKTTKRYSASATPKQRTEIQKHVRLNRMVLEVER